MHDSSISLRSSMIKNVQSVQIIYENGDTYNGSLKNGLRHGYGVLYEINNNVVYNGNWENDMVKLFIFILFIFYYVRKMVSEH